MLAINCTPDHALKLFVEPWRSNADDNFDFSVLKYLRKWQIREILDSENFTRWLLASLHSHYLRVQKVMAVHTTQATFVF